MSARVSQDRPSSPSLRVSDALEGACAGALISPASERELPAMAPTPCGSTGRRNVSPGPVMSEQKTAQPFSIFRAPLGQLQAESVGSPWIPSGIN